MVDNNSIQCVITSPPYWGLRDYGVAEQIGLEDTPEEYVNRLVELFTEVKRVLKEDGTIWLNLGDTYYGSMQGYGATKSSESGFQKAPVEAGFYCSSLKKPPMTNKHSFLKPKDLVGIPWRVAFALQQRLRLYLRQAIIWHKPNAMPSSVTDRPSTDYEFIFLLTKSERYFYNQEVISKKRLTQKNRPDGIVRQRTFNYKGKFSSFGDKAEQYGSPRARTQRNSEYVGSTGYTNVGGLARDPTDKSGAFLPSRNLRSVWSFNTVPYPQAHFAVFPEELPERCIKAGTREGDIVMDIFAGSGTTLWVAKRMLRNFIGFELSPEYVELAKNRIAQHILMKG